MNNMKSTTDLIILGMGPGGLSAAIYALRGGLSVKVIGRDTSALKSAASVENYFGFPEGITGSDLLERGKKQTLGLGGELLGEEILGIAWNSGFLVTTNIGEHRSKALIIATGSPRKKAAFKNMEKYRKNISECAVCDGFFYRDKAVAVAGAGEYALHEALILKKTAAEVCLLTNGEEPQVHVPAGIKVFTRPIIELTGREALEGAISDNGEVIRFSGLFLGIGIAASDELAKKMGIISENGIIKVDGKMMTNIPGVFAAGDCASEVKQIATAVSDGCRAALSAISFLKA